jgi:LiaI-LiaF-like transmembrane region
METKPTLSNANAQFPYPQRQRRGSLVAPVFLITLGSMFLAHQFVPAWEIRKTWPLLLVAVGLTKLFEALFSKES